MLAWYSAILISQPAHALSGSSFDPVARYIANLLRQLHKAVEITNEMSSNTLHCGLFITI